MLYSQRFRSTSAILLASALASCAPAQDDAIASTEAALFANPGFEAGAGNAPPPSWTVLTWLNSGITVQTPQTYAGLMLMPGGVASTLTLNSAGGPGTQADQALGFGSSFRWPRYGNQCVVLNGPNAGAQFTVGANRNVNELTQTMTIGAADVDPADSQIHIRFAMAPILMSPTGHAANQLPYYFVQVTNVTRGTILYTDFNLSTLGGTWQTSVDPGGDAINFTDWRLVDIAPGPSGIAPGDMVRIQLVASGCSPGAHWGELYVDGFGAVIPGLAVEGTGPAQANAGANITYTFTYRNGAARTACVTSADCTPNTEACVGGFCAETNVVIDVTPPANTTWQTYTAPAGATCVPMPSAIAGSTGPVTCTFTTPIPAGTSGSFTATVNINAGTTTPIVEASYDIHSTQETRLVGTPIRTRVGCNLDSDCTMGNWCNETAHNCMPQLPNGATIPVDPPHTTPTLNGTCTVAAATLVCVSHVCDVDNRCGYLNDDGPCTPASGPTVCRSGVCDPDGRCGYANGDGPCTTGATGNGGTVCRSGSCSVSAVCEPLGGCEVDGDCPSSHWCNETTHVCTLTIANGMPIPVDPPHTSPTLNGMCTIAAGALVCTSGVCDVADNSCGYAVGDGPCTSSNGSVVCRSSACSVNGLCEPNGGCNVDADCTTGNWCNESMHMCVPQIANGMPMPTDAAHTSPTLDGTCTAAAGAVACASGVCDPSDNLCGYANGDGPCSTTNGMQVCRSMVCGAASVCVQCVDGTTCPMAMPVCDVALGVCVQCMGTSATLCVSDMPVCDMATEMCVSCNGDFGTNATEPCPTSMNPFCTTTGACSACTDDASCRAGTHAGPICNVATGACGTVCATDSDCDPGNWCNDVGTPGAGACVAQLSNGDALPGGACTMMLGTRACMSGICASAGANAGHCEQCTQDSQCGGTTPVCNPSTNACVAAMPDAAVLDGGTTTDAGGVGDASTAGDASALDASGPVRDGGSTTSDGAASMRDTGSAGHDAGTMGSDGGGSVVSSMGACSCGAAGTGRGSSALAALGLAVVLGATRRRARS